MVTTVFALASVSLGTTLLLGRQVVGRCRELVRAAYDFGKDGTFSAPAVRAPAELAALRSELALTS